MKKSTGAPKTIERIFLDIENCEEIDLDSEYSPSAIDLKSENSWAIDLDAYTMKRLTWPLKTL